MKVVDASVVLGWVLGQNAREGSHSLLEGHLTGRDPLVAPELLNYEVANVLVSGAGLSGDLVEDAAELAAEHQGGEGAHRWGIPGYEIS